MAKRFTFRLETLRRLRAQREDEQKRVVAARLRKIQELETEKQQLQQRILEQTDHMRGWLNASTVDVDLLKTGRHWVLRLRRGVLETDARINVEKTMLAHERAALNEMRKQTRVLERLKEKQRETFYRELDRQEQITLDDINVTRFAHQGSPEGGFEC